MLRFLSFSTIPTKKIYEDKKGFDFFCHIYPLFLKVNIITSIDLELFTLKDKYTLISFAIFILIINIFIFLELESLKHAKKYQIKTKKSIRSYISLLAMIIILSFFITIPYLDQKTMVKEDILCEGLQDDMFHYIKLIKIENTHYPTYNDTNSVISYYTRDVRNQKYIEFENVSLYEYPRANKNDPVLYINNNSTILAITEVTKPSEYRGIETQSYWYSIIVVIYNLLIALSIYPLFLVYEPKIKKIWNTQNMVSSILLAIIISQTFIF